MAACVIAVNIGDARKRAGDEDKKVRPRGTGFRRFSCLRWSGRIAAGEPCLSQRYAHPRSGIAASSNHICTSSSGRGVGAAGRVLVRTSLASSQPRQFHQNLPGWGNVKPRPGLRSEKHTSEIQFLMTNSYAVLSLKKKNKAKP